jgi:hypothetical protein
MLAGAPAWARCNDPAPKTGTCFLSTSTACTTAIVGGGSVGEQGVTKAECSADQSAASAPNNLKAFCLAPGAPSNLYLCFLAGGKGWNFTLAGAVKPYCGHKAVLANPDPATLWPSPRNAPTGPNGGLIVQNGQCACPAGQAFNNNDRFCEGCPAGQVANAAGTACQCPATGQT